MSAAAAETTGRFAPTCAVVVCTRDRPALLDRCLAAATRLEYPRFGILVVGNAPTTDETREVARRWGAGYAVEPVPGLSRARNRGARASATDIMAYLDDDSLPEPDWLDAFVPEFDDGRVMAVTGRILTIQDGTESATVRALHATFDCGAERRVVDQSVASWFELANFGGVGDGGNMALRRRAFDIWPGFQERLGRGAWVPGGEEHHAFFSLVDRGHRVVYTPRAVVHHPYPRELRDFRARLVRNRAAAAGYMTLLLVEESRYRRTLLKYVTEWLAGKPRTWRALATPAQPRVVPRWRMAVAGLRGPLLYACARLGPTPTAGRAAACAERTRAGALDSAS